MTITRARACEGKRKLTRTEARAMVARLVREGAARGAMTAYRCKHGCGPGVWHVGHTLRRRGRR